MERKTQESQEQDRHMKYEREILKFDTGIGSNGNITRRVWHVFGYTNHKHQLLVYQDKSKGKIYLLVNVVTKLWIQKRDPPIILLMNYASLLDNTNVT